MTVTLIRTVILYLLIIAGLRLLGKHQLGELEPSELVLALIIADLASVPMQDNGIPLLSGVIPIIVLLCLSMIISVLTMRSVRFRALVCGRPSIVVRHGQVDQRTLRKNRFTIDELMEELRVQGYTDLSAICYAILETNGQLSILPNAAEKPLTAAQFGLSPQEGGLPVVLISAGELLEYAEYVGNYYGTSLKVIRDHLEQGTDVLLDIEVQGAAKVRQRCPEAVLIFIIPPSLEELSRRLHRRNTDSEDVIAGRLEKAKTEYREIPGYDYLVVNDSVPKAAGEIISILTAEGCRVKNRAHLTEGV